MDISTEGCPKIRNFFFQASLVEASMWVNAQVEIRKHDFGVPIEKNY